MRMIAAARAPQRLDDDTYPRLPQLRAYLAGFNGSQPHYLGRRLLCGFRGRGSLAFSGF
jgi:hypothetical protein